MGKYREVTLMPTLYRVYMAVLAEKITENMEEKGIIPHNQTGFRKGMGTIDNYLCIELLDK